MSSPSRSPERVCAAVRWREADARVAVREFMGRTLPVTPLVRCRGPCLLDAEEVSDVIVGGREETRKIRPARRD